MKQRVVVVDDSVICRALLRDWLQADGDLEVVGEAVDGDTAIEVISRLRPDVATIDLRMPGMPGLDLIKAVRADGKLAKMPVLMLTAEAKREQIIEAAQAGVNGYVIKPFTAETLKEKLDKILGPGK